MPRAERIVEVIPATWNPTDESAGEIRKLRVAAYCRVSTELEQQQSSYDIQIEYYTRHIMQNPNWIFAGVFADDGRSATNTFRRDDFNQLMDQCLKGKVDMVITVCQEYGGLHLLGEKAQGKERGRVLREGKPQHPG